ncbi:hypothetical protein KAW48_11070 [candidate division WOR-3 bacterium]|nr:hypothetical protein [candidate division WOR-3 bacterium]
MRNKFLWLIVGAFIVAGTGGFFFGRFFTIRRNASFIAREMPTKFPVEEIKRYRREMKHLRVLMDKERAHIIWATKSGEMEKLREHIDSISKLKREILIQTTNQLHEIAKTLPPSMREPFIEHMLKEPHGKHRPGRVFKIIKRRY